ncbi:MAG: hypothetical protein D6805_06450 [Planctomycetota bacterium]|nr:MAG: hypothetical protein D6805_06450 [Planctomycetota bacterium]
MLSKRNFLLSLLALSLLLLPPSLASSNATSPFRATITDVSGVQATIHNVTALRKGGFSLFGGGGGESGETKLSLQYGMAEISLPFQSIARLELEKPASKYCEVIVYLRNGKQLKAKIKSQLQIQGKLPSNATYKIKAMYIKSLTFSKQTASLQRCPTCKRHYLEKSWKFCPYDGQKLQTK